MAHILTKRGAQDNIVTYEHMCDTHADLNNIPSNQMTLGSTAIVLRDENDALGVYMSDSNKEWVPLLAVGGETTPTPSPVDLLHVLSSSDYDPDTHVPTVENPEMNVVYLVPSGEETGNNLFDEWIYTGDSWERFGGVPVNNTAVQADWNEDDESADAHVLNRPNVRKGSDPTGVVEGMLQNVASGEYSHAEGNGTIAAGRDAHSEGFTTAAFGDYSHVEGEGSQRSGKITLTGAANATTYDYESLPSGFNSSDAKHFYIVANNQYYLVTDINSDTKKIAVKKTLSASAITSQVFDIFYSSTIATGYAAHAEGFSTAALGTYSHAEGNQATASNSYAHAEGTNTVALGYGSHAEGSITTASGSNSHAEGQSTTASGEHSHAEGSSTQASAIYSHAEGYNTVASGSGSHAEGENTTASGEESHAEGANTLAYNEASHAEGISTNAMWHASHAEGRYSLAAEDGAHAEGYGDAFYVRLEKIGTSNTYGFSVITSGYTLLNNSVPPYYIRDNNKIYYITSVDTTNSQITLNTIIPMDETFKDVYVYQGSEAPGPGAHAEGASYAKGSYSHAEGFRTATLQASSHAEGQYTQATSTYAHAEGNATRAKGMASHAEGNGNNDQTVTVSTHNTLFIPGAEGVASHAEGYQTHVTAMSGHAEGYQSEAYDTSGIPGAHAEGYQTRARWTAHSEGNSTQASGQASHAEGTSTKATSMSAHAEGTGTQATNQSAHAEGTSTQATQQDAHAEGTSTKALRLAAHAEGQGTTANGIAAHTEGQNTLVYNTCGHAEGRDTLSDGTGAHAEGDSWTGSSINITLTHLANDPTNVYHYSNVSSEDTLLTKAGHIIINNSYSRIIDVDTSNDTITLTSSLGIQNDKPTSFIINLGPIAYDSGAHAEGVSTVANGVGTHAEGGQTQALRAYAHAEGNYTVASEYDAHAEGAYTGATGSNSHAEGYHTQASGTSSHAEGEGSPIEITGVTIGTQASYSFMPGAAGQCSHAEGYQTAAKSISSHAEGYQTVANAHYSHTEGSRTWATADAAHAEGYTTTASGTYSHAEGYLTQASGYSAHAEGALTAARGYASHAEGCSSNNELTWHRQSNTPVEKVPSNYTPGAAGQYSHVEGAYSYAGGMADHAEGYQTCAMGSYSHAEGYQTAANGSMAHAEGDQSVAKGEHTHAEGEYNLAEGTASHAEGSVTYAAGNHSHTEGERTTATGEDSHAEGFATKAIGKGSHAENGWDTPLIAHITITGEAAPNSNTPQSFTFTVAAGSAFSFGAEYHPCNLFLRYDNTDYLITEYSDTNHTLKLEKGINLGVLTNAQATIQQYTVAIGDYSHAEGAQTVAIGAYSHAEGDQTTAVGRSAHAEGTQTQASGYAAHAEGSDTHALGNYSHAEGLGMTAVGRSQHVFGEYMDDNSVVDPDERSSYVEIVGNGLDANSPSNARTLDWDGNETLAGALTCSNSITIGNTTVTEAQLQALLALLP